MSILSLWGLGGLFALWIVLTIAFQFRRLQAGMRIRDPLFMLPSWSFFAPVPNTSDFTFCVRYDHAGEMTPWRRPHHPSHRSLSFLWDPGRRQRKVVVDLSQSIAESTKSGGTSLIHFSTCYLLLLKVASTQPETLFATGVQVAIAVRPSGAQNYELFFQSHVHELGIGPALVPSEVTRNDP
ncbi:hypothetical protein AB0C96_41670 [Streptomyces sp. NPDC048506]|uniref:hypothetical protein n=1 Tax=Streptomyces sp. NPDC048506 TaxID=3155028 RepID=UPI00341A6771